MKDRIILSAILVIIVNLLAAGNAGAEEQGSKGAAEQGGIRVGWVEERNPTEQGDAGKPSKEEVIQKTQTLRMPFIVNNGQMDEQVRFYAKTFGGTVFVTKDGEIVYSLPSGRDVPAGASQESGRGMKHGGRGAEGQGNREGGEQGSGGTGEQGRKVVLGWHGQAPLVRAELAAANAYSPLLHADNANCPSYHIFAKSLLASYLPGLLVETTRWVVCPSSTPPNSNPNSQFPPTRAVALKEQLVGGKINEIKGGVQSITTVSYFKGNDPSKWKSSIPTCEVVDMGEVYEGIDLSLKAHGNNVEKLFTVKPGANPEQIKISLSGVKDCGMRSAECGIECPKSKIQNPKLQINHAGELVAETELGPVKFTKPVAYQEIDGKRVEVAVEYRIQGPGIDGMEGRGAGDQGGRGEPKLASRSQAPAWERYCIGSSSFPCKKAKSSSQERQMARKQASDVGDAGTIAYYEAGASEAIAFPSWSLGTRGENPHSTTSDSQNPKSEYSFTVASYDRTKPLIIDPLLASTFLGGSSWDVGYSLTLDTSGNVYVTGYTFSSNFPTTSGAYDTSSNSYRDVFVSKLNSELTNLLASTFLGGSGDDYGYSLTLDTSGNVYVTGYTQSSNFPTTSGAYDTSYNTYDVFVSKLDGGLTSLLASTFLGGSNVDYGKSITLDTSGNVYVTGYTVSTNFPTTSGAYDTSQNGSSYYDVFVSKLDTGLANLVASTYLGGSDEDVGNAIALDTSGNVYVTGYTYSSNFPTTSGAYDTSINGGCDVFVSKLNSGLTSLLASTFLGGSIPDNGYSLTLDTSGNVYVTGYTGSSNFPTTSGAYNTSSNGYDDVFVSKLNSGLTSLLASTFLGGSGTDFGYSLTLDTSGNVYVTGGTYSTNFPTTSGAYDTSFNGVYYTDVFVSKLNSGLTSLLASTFLGGSDNNDYGNSLTLDTSGNVYVTGYTGSSNFPTTSGAYNTSYNGGYDDVFVSKLDGNLSAFSAPTATTDPATSVTTSSATLNGTVNANETSTTAWFDYGTISASYTGSSTTQSVSGTSSTSVSIGISGLSASTTYYYRIAAQNGVGTSYGDETFFTTDIKDIVAPSVVSTSPADGATGAVIFTRITATFSEAMDAATINTSTFLMSGGMTGTVGYDSTTKTATFIPSTNLAHDTAYTATITTGAKDNAGNSMLAAYTWNFTTSSGIGEVLILDTTVTGGADSLEAVKVAAIGKTPVVVSAATWASMTTADFASYDAIVFGDPTCGWGVDSIGAAEANKAVWSAAITGNVVVIGTDPEYHSYLSGPQNLIEKGINYASNEAGKTGLYCCLSCYYDDAPSGTPVPLLDNISGGGFTVVSGGCGNNSHIVAVHPALSGLTDADLSNWYCSTHEGFVTWPSDFLVLAISKDVPSSFVAADGTTGAPYIVARGQKLVVLSDIHLSPVTATNPIGASHTVTATVTRDSMSVEGATVTFLVLSGPHAGTTGSGTTDRNGAATFSYTGTSAGEDTIEASFVDFEGKTQKSNRVKAIWEETSTVITTFQINNGAAETSSRTVTLNNTATGSPTHYMASVSSSFTGASWQTYTDAPSFILASTYAPEQRLTLAAGDGAKTVYFKVKNVNGESAVVSDDITLKELPVVSTFQVNNGAVETSSRTVTINNTVKGLPTHYMASESAGFADAAWQTYTTTPRFTLSDGDGAKTVYFKVKNANGESAVVSDDITLKELPVVSTFQINNGASETNSRTVTLNNTATGSPTHYMASESSSFTGASWQVYAAAPSFTLSTGYGVKTVYFKVKNASGESAVVSDVITLKELPVVSTFQINNGAAETNGRTVTLNNTATGSPTHYMASESASFADATWLTYAEAPGFTLSAGNGAKTVYFKVKNASGESAVVTDAITLKELPVVSTFQINNGAAETMSRTVTLNNTATGSPTQYMASESPTFKRATWKAYTGAPKFTLSTSKGVKTVYFKVKNAKGESSVVSDSITLKKALAAAVADAGIDQWARKGSVITLDGSKSFSHEEHVPLAYEWSFISRPSGMGSLLSDPQLVNPTFTLSRRGKCELQLVVKDSLGTAGEPDTVIISTQDTAPVAHAGSDQSIREAGTRVMLNGAQSYDPDGDVLAYHWTFISRPVESAAFLEDVDTARPGFVVDATGDYVIQLTVTDSQANSSSDTVTVSFGNVRPVANAGKSLSVKVGDTVTLAGDGMDANGDALSYHWMLSSFPEGSLSEIADSTSPITTFTPDRAGVYVAQLVVSDGELESEPRAIQIQAFTVQTKSITALLELEVRIAELDSTVFKNGDMQNILLNKLNAVIANVEAGKYEDAANQLRNDVLPKMGGVEGQEGDSVVWIIDRSSQRVWYQEAQDVVRELEMAR